MRVPEDDWFCPKCLSSYNKELKKGKGADTHEGTRTGRVAKGNKVKEVTNARTQKKTGKVVQRRGRGQAAANPRKAKMTRNKANTQSPVRYVALSVLSGYGSRSL